MLGGNGRLEEGDRETGGCRVNSESSLPPPPPLEKDQLCSSVPVMLVDSHVQAFSVARRVAISSAVLNTCVDNGWFTKAKAIMQPTYSSEQSTRVREQIELGCGE